MTIGIRIRDGISISIGICICTFPMVDLEMKRKLLFNFQACSKKEEKWHHAVVMVLISVNLVLALLLELVITSY